MEVCTLALQGVGVGVGFVERGLVLRPFRPAVPFKAFLLFRRISSAPVW
jgi:hypothetical protein